MFSQLRKITHSLRYRIAITIFLLEAIMITIILWQTTSVSEKKAYELYEAANQVTLNIFNDLSAVALSTETYDELQQYVEQAVIDPKIDSIILVSQDNRVVVSDNFNIVGQEFKNIKVNKLQLKSKGIYDLGTLYIEFSNKDLIDNFIQTRRVGMEIGIIGMFTIAFMGLMIGYVLTRKLEQITKAAKSFGEGDFDIELPNLGSDEIGVMGESLKLMQYRIQSLIEDLKYKHEELKQANNSLELKVQERTEDLLLLNDQLKNASEHDELTRLYNRRKFNNFIKDELFRTDRAGTCFSLVLIDVDYFKNYNDNYGHQKGDECLASVALAMSRCLPRTIDFIARYGGEEFVVILPSTNSDGAKIVAEQLRQTVSSLNIKHEYSTVSSCVSISLGIAIYRANDKFSTKDIINNADQCLYLAKSNGRNRVEVCSKEQVDQ